MQPVSMEGLGGFCEVAFVCGDKLWWSLDHFRTDDMLQQNQRSQKQIYKFVAEFNKVQKSQCNVLGMTDDEEVPESEDHNMASTLAILVYLLLISSDLRFTTVNETRTERVRHFLSTLVHKVQAKIETGPEIRRMTVTGHGDVSIEFSNRGQVYFGAWVKTVVPQQMLHWLKQTWTSVRETLDVGLGNIEEDGTCYMCDLMKFFFNWKLIKRGKWSKNDKKLYDGLFLWLVKFLSTHLNAIFLTSAQERLAADFVPPARVTTGGYVKVEPLAVWQLVEDAKALKQSVLQVLKTRLQDAEREQFNSRYRNCSESQAKIWQQNYLSAYMERVKTLTRSAVQFSLVTDASTHSCKEMLVSLCFANGHAVVVPITVCKKGDVGANEVDSATLEQMKEILKKKDIERTSSWHFLRAISHQLSVLTDGRVTIESFKIDNLAARRPVQAGEERIRRTQTGYLAVTGLGDYDVDAMGPDNQPLIQVKVHTAYISKADGSTVPVLPEEPAWHIQQPILTVSTDQDAVNTAGFAFLLPTHMLHVRCDKIHRAIRDYKLAIGHAAEGLFLKTQLHSGYIFSINYKPFNKGNFFEQKKEMIEHFLSVELLVLCFSSKFCVFVFIVINK